jgi:alkyldihydroxyacetonephosphate synthase
MPSPTAVQEKALIYPEPLPADPHDAVSLDVWGFSDTGFAINERGNAVLTGHRYELSGVELPALLPWVRDVLGIEFDPKDSDPGSYPSYIAPALENPAFQSEIARFLKADQATPDGRLRLRHGHGHTQDEVFAIKHERLERIPDLVVFPESDEQVAQLVAAAERHGVVLIPFGGGTNVTDALRCAPDERRFIVSVDMQRMSRVLWIDKANLMACIQAGAIGRNIAAQLRTYGYTMGHEPDSVEFSTLGGWIATNASGMKKNKYGNIEDLVLDVTVATADGKLDRAICVPRESIGSDLRRLLFGSEGTLGIITSAVVKIFPLPEVQAYGSVLFPTFEDGFAFVRELAREPALPASVRLIDNAQFKFGMALKAATQGLGALKSRAEKFFVTKLKGFDPDKMVVCTLVFEGTAREVADQERTVYRLASRHGGMKAGAENGRRGYQLTFSIAYIRDFLMNYYIVAESFETSAAWSDVLPLIANVTRRLEAEYKARNLPHKVFVTARVTQMYQTGAAIYFYFGFYFKGVPHPSRVYHELENIAREEILRSGGSLSHHHGVGKIRQEFLPAVMSPAALEWKRELKRSLDPANIFGAGNQSA